MIVVVIVGIAVALAYYGFVFETGEDPLGLTKLSPAEIATVASNAGFSGDDLVTAVAVALAESGGNPGAYNPETAAGAPSGYGSYGLWQIYLNAHREYDANSLYDPQYNAQAAFAIYSAAGNSFSPWSTYTGGNYAAYISQAEDGVENG